MPNDEDSAEERRTDPSEGVRIIGAEEAQAAVGREDVAPRLPTDAPRFGDRPEQPAADGPRPAIRFPLSNTADPSAVERQAVVPVEPVMPHWTDPPTGEVPRAFAATPADDYDDLDEDLDAWSSFTSSQPRWRGEGPTLDDGDGHDFAGFRDDTNPAAFEPAPEEDFFSYDDSAYDDPDDDYSAAPATTRISSDPRRAAPRSRPAAAASTGGRDVPTAVAVGAGIAAVFLVLAKVGPEAVLGLVVLILAAAVVELFNALRRGGFQPVALVGITATVLLPLAVYAKGEVAYPLVLGLTAMAVLGWFLVGAGGDDSPVLGAGSTLLGVGYVGVLGSYAALCLALPDGLGVLFGAVLGAVGADVLAFFVGRSRGTRPLSSVSPNKSVEGFVGGIAGAVLGLLLLKFGVTPWKEFALLKIVLIGVLVAVAATIGDLCESLLKRDLDIKDMGSVLPGHGGVLDRFDAMLFVLPTVYYSFLLFHP